MFYPGELTELIRRDLGETFFDAKETIVTMMAALALATEARKKPGVSIGDLLPWDRTANTFARVSCLKVYESVLLFEFEETQVDDRIWSVAAVAKDTSETEQLWHINAYTLVVTVQYGGHYMDQVCHNPEWANKP
jgi:hypothetical protein